MFSRFFIDRPIFAAVLAIFIVIAGLSATRSLPIAQYPEIAPPVVSVTAIYPGASAEVIEQTVAAPLENAINGVEHMIYMGSTSTSNGTVVIQISFDIGTDVDQAAQIVNNRVKQVETKLPQEVRRQGVTVEKGSSAFLQVLAFYSDDGSKDDLTISNYVTLNVLDSLKRVPGTTNVQIFGAKDYAMRIWLRPDRLAQLKLTTSDIARAVNEQNAQFAAGKVGQAPTGGAQEMVYTITTQGRLSDPKQFEEIIVRANPDGSTLRLKDVARVELGSKDYDFIGRVNGKAATLVGIFLQPGANALNVAKEVDRTVDELSKRFPKGIVHSVVYDTTRFVKVSIEEVAKTLGEAMVLVILVVFLFLQNWRATFIPVVAVPVSLIGTLAGLLLLGYSINTLTLFGMVLAIGIVVDDAIVVLENVERIMHEEQMAAREAAIKAMREVSGPVIAIVLTLCAVFVPIAFLGGLTGELYRQFAVTISIAVVISGIVALTLTPSLCVILLKREHKAPGRLFAAFNRVFQRITGGYVKGVGFMVRRAGIGLALFAGMVMLAVGLWRITPGSLVPDEDQGFYISAVILPDGASLQRTDEVVGEVVKIIKSNPYNLDAIAFTGFDFLGGGYRNNAATIFVTQTDWDKRPVPVQALVGELFMKTGHIKEALVLAFNPPPIFGLGTAGGFEFYVQNRGEGGSQRLAQVSQQFMGAASQSKMLGGVQTLWRASVAAAVRGGRPRARQGARRAGGRTVQHAVVHARQLLRQRLQQVRPHLAGADVGRGGLSQAARRHRPHVGALDQWRHGAGVGAGEHQVLVGARDAGPLQQLAGSEDVRPGRARHQLGAGDRRSRAHRQAGVAARLQLRLGRRVVPGEALVGHLGAGAGARCADGVLDPVGAVREVVAAAERVAGIAVRHLRRTGRGVAARHDQRRVLPDRPGHAARSGGEERDPDRRVRIAQAPRGHERIGRLRSRRHGCASGRSS